MDENERYSWQNTLSLTLGYGALFSGLVWIYGRMPEAPFFRAAGFLLLSVTLFFSILLLESFLFIWLRTHDEQARNTRIGKVILFTRRHLVRYWAWFFLVESILAGVTASILIFYSFAAGFDLSYENEMTALRRENAVLRQELDMALSTLLHERIMHFKR